MKHLLSVSVGSESASFMVQAWPALACLSEDYLLLLLTRFYVQVICMTGMWLPFRNFIWIQREWLQELEINEEFFFSSAAGPLLTLAQHCKGKQIPKLNTDLKIGRLLYLALRFSQEENKRAVTSEDVLPLHLDLKSQCWGSTTWVALFECTEISWTPGGLQKDSPSAQGSSQDTAWEQRGWGVVWETCCTSSHD